MAGTVLLTGASSFTGLWFAEALAVAGWRVVAPLRRPAGDYAGIRALRVARLRAAAEITFDAPLGSARLLDVVRRARADIFAHHAADIPGYRDPDYDVEAGVARNLTGLPEAIAAFADSGGGALLATGTYFEPGEGGGEAAASPYGLSKGITNAQLRRLALNRDLAFGKFVITSPFGRWEEGRIVWSLFQAWTQGRTAEIRTPAYVRDQIPAPLLADAYARAAAELAPGADLRFRPSGLVSSVGAFAERVAEAAQARTGLACDLHLAQQTAFAEPERRANDQPETFDPAGWAAFWDDYVAYYEEVAGSGLLYASAA